MALKKSELYSSLWSSCDELRGGMDAESAALEAKLAKARQNKQGMMQDLLTGRI
jgi:type I restriction-modification system DNA methylase subunit